jgi:hypothetical protein
MRRSRANNIGMHTIITVRQPSSSLPPVKRVRVNPIRGFNPKPPRLLTHAEVVGRFTPSKKQTQKKREDEQREKNAPQRWIRNLDLDKPEPTVQEQILADARYEAQVLPETRQRWEENRRRVEEWERKQRETNE